MFCRNCGKEINDGAKFCTECGYTIADDNGEKNFVPPAGKKIKKTSNKALFIGAAVVIAVFILIMAGTKNKVESDFKKASGSPIPEELEALYIGDDGCGLSIKRDGSAIFYSISNQSGTTNVYDDPQCGYLDNTVTVYMPFLSCNIYADCSEGFDRLVFKSDSVAWNTETYYKYGKPRDLSPNEFKKLYSSLNMTNLEKGVYSSREDEAQPAKTEKNKSETKASNDTEAEEEPSNDDEDPDAGDENDDSSDNRDANEVDPDMKAFLDEYESFIDSYIAFMQDYNNSGDITGMLSDYGSMLAKLSDFGEKAERYDESKMSKADYDYYVEAMTRINAKMLKAAY